MIARRILDVDVEQARKLSCALPRVRVGTRGEDLVRGTAARLQRQRKCIRTVGIARGETDDDGCTLTEARGLRAHRDEQPPLSFESAFRAIDGGPRPAEDKSAANSRERKPHQRQDDPY